MDLVVRRGRVIIFCEVKYRRTAVQDGIPSPEQQRV
ncbi:MAG: YraN family protein [SAR116 cluster bacterium]|nr:YraN family protein [SAR116 cluster bacterium]